LYKAALTVKDRDAAIKNSKVKVKAQAAASAEAWLKEQLRKKAEGGKDRCRKESASSCEKAAESRKAKETRIHTAPENRPPKNAWTIL
jgi:hypothetical protein